MLLKMCVCVCVEVDIQHTESVTLGDLIAWPVGVFTVRF